jgi:hypothetical protein
MLTSYNPNGPAEISPGMFFIPGGGLVHYVHASGSAGLDLLPSGIAAPSPGGFHTTINAAIGACRSNRGDTVYVLPGHTESVSSADYLSGLGTKTGITVQGIGYGANRPTLTWTTAGSTLLFDAAGFVMRNFNLFLAGAHAAGTALTVAAPISFTASGCELTDSDIFWGFDADQIVTIGITTTAAATKLKFNRNYCFAETAAVPTTTFLRITGCDQMEIDKTMIIGAGSTVAIGPVQQLTTGSKGMRVTNSTFINTLASSTHSFTAIAGCTGIVDNCAFGVLAAGNGLTTGSGLQVTNSKTAVAAAAGADTTG